MIKVRNLTKKIEDTIIFSNVTFEVSAGEMLAIQGASGSGKSTLLNIIGQLEDDYSGLLEITGIETKTLSAKQKRLLLRNQISYLFQNYALIPEETVKYNLELALKYIKLSKAEREEKIKKGLQELHIESLYDRYVYSLSGGEQQRVSMVRSLLKPGSVILADEPTGNLDSKNSQIVLTFLQKQATQGKTVIIVTHDDQIANQCTIIYDLEKGELH